MKFSFFTLLLFFPYATPLLNACERTVSYDDTVREYFKRDPLNSLYFAWLIEKKIVIDCTEVVRLEEPETDRAYGIIDGSRIPDNVKYVIFTTFPMQTPEHVLPIVKNNKIEYEGVVTGNAKVKVLQEMFAIQQPQNYQARAQEHERTKSKNAPEYDFSKRIKEEMLTVHKMENVTKKRLKIYVSIQNSSGRESLFVTESN